MIISVNATTTKTRFASLVSLNDKNALYSTFDNPFETLNKPQDKPMPHTSVTLC